MGTLRFFEEVVSFKIRRTFGFADYTNLLPIAFRSFSEARTETRDRLPPEINTDIGESFRILFRIFDFYSDNSASEKHK